MKLKKYLKTNDIKNSELALVAGVGQATISEFLNHKRGITFRTACKISDSLGISLDEFRKMVEV